LVVVLADLGLGRGRVEVVIGTDENRRGVREPVEQGDCGVCVGPEPYEAARIRLEKTALYDIAAQKHAGHFTQ
jgi:hypothetical protein